MGRRRMRNYLARLFRYVAWANRRTWESLQATPAAEGEALPLLAHVLAAEHIWLARLELREPRHAVWPILDATACRALIDENETGYQNLLLRLDSTQLDASIRYRTSRGDDLESARVDMLFQAITHGGYHRGQIAKIIGRFGGAVLNTDLITFTREAPESR